MNTSKQRILFLVHTEYHIMVALSIVADLYDDMNKFEISICQTENFSNTRFQFEKNIKLKSNIKYYVIRFDERELKYNRNLINAINNILNTIYDVFIMFNHHGFLPVYLSKQLYKKGTDIYLAPDGLKPFVNSKRITPRWSIKRAINYFRFLKVNKLPIHFNFPILTYANLKEIKKVFVQFPDKYDNISKKEVEKVNVLSTTGAKDLVNSYFKFDISKELETSEKIIFYMNQPFKNQAIYDFEMSILIQLQLQLSVFKLVIKLHPLTSNGQKKKFNQLKNVELITKSYPAELYIAKLKNSIVISFWSTACLINNEKASVYWLYPALIKNKIMLNFVNIKNPTDHIKEIEEIEEIKWE